MVMQIVTKMLSVGLWATPQLSIKFHQNPLVSFSIIQWIRISDFGLPMDLAWQSNDNVPVIRIVTKIEPIVSLAMPCPSKKCLQNPFTTFSVIRRTDRQTNRPNQKRNSFGDGNDAHIPSMCPSIAVCTWTDCHAGTCVQCECVILLIWHPTATAKSRWLGSQRLDTAYWFV